VYVSLLISAILLMFVFPPFALMQKVEPKDQGCPDAPPGSRANAQQPRAACCIIHFANNLSFPALSSLHASVIPLCIGH
jgi:hypothetical protein